MTDRSELASHLRLLTGDGVAASLESGAALITAACQGGSPEAARMLAVLEAMGLGRPQSWDRAFDYLRIAAERGSARAQAELRLLSRNDFGPESSLSEDPCRWEHLRARIDVSALVTAPERRSLSENPRIRMIEGFASAAECDWLVSIARGRLEQAQVWDPGTGTVRADPNRTNKALEIKIGDMDVVTEAIRARISSATALPVPVFEPAQIMHYQVGEEFKPHYDFLDPAKPGFAQHLARFGQRIATFLIFLNDDYEGGETFFPQIGLRHRGAKGDALFFANIDHQQRPDPRTLHAGLPPTRGEKWILSQWVRDRTPASPAARGERR